ncbi:MAG: hypothetical protein KDD89_03125 [Anaerolineales bacterium]|nr:hypothetical protein [Anaerolineales bacterium]
MSKTADYIHEIELAFIASPAIQSFEILRTTVNSDTGFIRIRAKLRNEDFLEVAEFFVWEQNQIHTLTYRYQWMSPDQQTLRKRWDNAPHYPELAQFPHHVHDGDELTVRPGEPLTLLTWLPLLEKLLPE